MTNQTIEFTNRQLSDIFWASPTGKKMLAEARERQLSERRVAADAIAEINQRAAAEFEKAQARYDAADADYKKAFDALKKADSARREAYGQRHSVGARADLARRPHEKMLAASADERIQMLAAAISKAHAVQPTPREHTLRDIAIEQQARRMAAMQELDLLSAEPLGSVELDGRLTAIAQRAGVNLLLTPNQN